MVEMVSAMVPLGTKVPDFALPDTEGNTVSRSDYDGQPMLVMFICNHCPFVKHIAGSLGEVCKAIQERDIAVIAINSNDVENYPHDSPEHMKVEVARRGYTFPYLFDETQDVAKAFSAQCTPDFFLYDADHKLVYRGQYDAARPGNGKAITGRDLLGAVGAMMGGAIADEQIPSMGCNIKWKE
jgi:peroxiredoxin